MWDSTWPFYRKMQRAPVVDADTPIERGGIKPLVIISIVLVLLIAIVAILWIPRQQQFEINLNGIRFSRDGNILGEGPV